MNDFLASQLVDSGDLLRELCKAKQKLYLQIDSTFKIELALIGAMTGQLHGARKFKDTGASYSYGHEVIKCRVLVTS